MKTPVVFKSVIKVEDSTFFSAVSKLYNPLILCNTYGFEGDVRCIIIVSNKMLLNELTSFGFRVDSGAAENVSLSRKPDLVSRHVGVLFFCI